MPKIVGNTIGVPNPKSDLAQTDPTKADFVKNKKMSLLENDMGYLTEHQDISSKADKNLSNVDDETFKQKAEQAGVCGSDVIVDDAMSDTSENPVQNKVVKGYIDDITGNISEAVNNAVGETQAIRDGLEDGSITVPITYFAEEAGYAHNAFMAEYDVDGWSILPLRERPDVPESGEVNIQFNSHNMLVCPKKAIKILNLSFTCGVILPYYFSAEIQFDSGETPTMLVYPASHIINWVGTDCTISEDNYSIFAPQANTHYDVYFYFNGTNIAGLVNGYKIASGNA